ncbi:MAG: hypothetical protein JWP03_1054 [Phycisphaerales bacterium]|nr:hypothetical protein [Phycisphaerales bacterium]
METLDQQIQEIARRHNLSESSAAQLVRGLLATGGGQVQFNVPEFGGMGQWMPGMIMAGDMFNHALKARVDFVCTDIAQRVRSGDIQAPAPARGSASTSLAWNQGAQWWPGDLGAPATSGGQNNLRYAWFPATRRLAVDLGGNVWVYDTGDHNIGGVSQQQSGGGMTLTFTSQHGVVDVAALPVISRG